MWFLLISVAVGVFGSANAEVPHRFEDYPVVENWTGPAAPVEIKTPAED